MDIDRNLFLRAFTIDKICFEKKSTNENFDTTKQNSSKKRFVAQFIMWGCAEKNVYFSWKKYIR